MHFKLITLKVYKLMLAMLLSYNFNNLKNAFGLCINGSRWTW